MTNTQTDRPTFDVMTNGDDVLFVKLTTQPSGKYGLSRVFSLYITGRVTVCFTNSQADWSGDRSRLIDARLRSLVTLVSELLIAAPVLLRRSRNQVW
jgi:hypothetical protein